MLLVFKTLWSKVGAWVVAAAAILGLILKYGHDKKLEGEKNLRDKINKETENVQKEWDRIDRRDTDVDDALDRLSGNRKN